VNTLMHLLDNRSTEQIWNLAVLSMILISIFSFLLGASTYLEAFYFLPIVITSWYGARNSGITLSLITCITLALVEIVRPDFSTIKILAYWLPFTISLVFTAILVTSFRNAHRVESVAADTDNLTNLLNSRSFYFKLAGELLRSSRNRQVLSLAYLDIDDFKLINDSQGHAEGDKLLIEVAVCLQNSLRVTDTVARLGGDEFVCLLPETQQPEAKVAISAVAKELNKRMIDNKWSVSFSIGLVTFETIPKTSKEAIKISDELMYLAKKSGKNNIFSEIYSLK